MNRLSSSAAHHWPRVIPYFSPLPTIGRRSLTAAMPPKRKRVEAHPPPPKPDAPRRASRRIKEQSANSGSPEPSLEPSHPMRLWETKEGVQKAMRELSEMEHKFQSVVRKQRLAVETSELSIDADPNQPDLRPKPHPPTRDIICIKPEGPSRSQEQSPLNGHEADVAMGDIDDAAEETPERGASRPPPVNSDKLPLPWLGRLGYACLNTYLRAANPPVFSSRTCRLASIIDHRHPLQDPSQPEHPTKNRPDKSQTPQIEMGQKYVQELGLLNARDIVKMIRWNEKYGIKFMRLSSEMFPFASHAEHGYRLAPFASEVLAEAGKVAGELGHRLTTHPGQFTQIGSPRKEVVEAAVRDLEYHDEMLSLLKLPEQADRDAIMIVHMGGTYGDKSATLDRFRGNYQKLSDGVKKRLVLENDDVSWSVHDLLPICEELNIPLVLDFHHHNIVFDSTMREGTKDIIDLYDRIRQTWTRKNIRQKMHYSEPTKGAITPRERRKHSPRVKTLPPCVNDMDLMIEAKDKEQAVFELMRAFKLPGHDRFNDMVPHERDDEPRKVVKKNTKKGKKGSNGIANGDDEIPERVVGVEEFGMGGPDNRVYWPEGMEEWLKPKKREFKGKKDEKDQS